MKKKGVILIVLLLLVNIFVLVVDADNQPLASFKQKINKDFGFKRDQYIPVASVAEILNYRFNWYFEENLVKGNIDDTFFSSNDFIIISGELYLHAKFFRNYLGLKIEYRGNHYFIYRIEGESRKGLEIKININKSVYDYREPIPVSLLLFNKSEESIRIKYKSGQKYDLVVLKNNREIWRLSEGRGFIPSINTMEIAAKDYKLYTELIPEDVRLSRGNYTLVSEVLDNNETLLSNRISFSVD